MNADPPTAQERPTAEPATARALWPTFLRRTLAEEVVAAPAMSEGELRDLRPAERAEAAKAARRLYGVAQRPEAAPALEAKITPRPTAPTIAAIPPPAPRSGG